MDTEYHANDEISAGEDAPQLSDAHEPIPGDASAPEIIDAAETAIESESPTETAKPHERFAYFVAIGKLRRRSVFLAPEDMDRYFGRSVIVDAEYGLDLGLLRERAKEIPSETSGAIVRLADCGDIEHSFRNAEADAECSQVFDAAVLDENLDMKLVGIDHSFEQTRITFYYQASGRVDFRQLVKVLASKLRRRIELYQLNLRDQFLFHAYIGPCGLELCCKAKPELFPEKIPTRLAKLQKLSYSPGKMSGMCGKPYCCLKYEAESYQEFADFLGIKPGAPFRRKGGDRKECRVMDWNMLTNEVFVDIGEEDKELVFTLEEFKREFEPLRRHDHGKQQQQRDDEDE